MKLQLKRKWPLLLCLLFLASAALWFSPMRSEYQNARKIQAMLDTELQKIELPNDGGFVASKASKRPLSVWAEISSRGGSLSSYASLVKYFDIELPKRGWHYVSEDRLPIWSAILVG